MNRQIFREEYLTRHYNSEQSQILLLHGFSHRIIITSCLFIILSILTLLTFGTYTKKSYLEGVIMPSTGLIAVKASQDGIVEQVFTQEGQQVDRSIGLLEINSEIFDSNGQSIHQSLKRSLQQQYDSILSQQRYEKLMSQARTDELKSKIERLKLEIQSAQQSLRLAKERTALKNESNESYRKLLESKYISDLTFKDYLSSLVALKADEESKIMLIQQLERELVGAQYQFDYMQQEGKVRDVELARQLDGIVQQQIELTATTEAVIYAPVSGEVSALRIENGQAVSRGEVLLNIIPETTELQVELYAPSRAVGFLQTGQSVGLRIDAYPFEKFGIQTGTIKRVTKSTLSPTEIKSKDQTIRSDAETLYRVIVALNKPTITVYGREEPLKVGMKVSADVYVETRQLYEWLLGPITRLKG
ncbi:HlyD family secretion protein [Vibrio cholerae]|uniref:HlyD family efflux transporter periplasmic adaptor subunit n=2 Tax=Vibrio cholerae TaxID=666 RepID=A0A6B3LL09_VIBCL|nr:HlyD family efflux transporter periplasmic adaptor subunit [Vibrio cholerae]EGQ9966607.1 HlyD family efflux transporter periplasmic adaptor subunit [Vibrio cholerae]EGR0380350.1 HlyD family efflux transporter periplasmic adaptor subunit [Vibrio cholerae]EGR2107133.1 HlyD family efflux transporter periplasmic adaptor subunit [Vibrio cholerae]EHQ2335961.1 HlyD family efflux transporter periplasmic adaptor subunit [Vibrio cholerae]EJL6593454.1 HlyD family efflux transporter periplasmic adaptor